MESQSVSRFAPSIIVLLTFVTTQVSLGKRRRDEEQEADDVAEELAKSPKRVKREGKRRAERLPTPPPMLIPAQHTQKKQKKASVYDVDEDYDPKSKPRKASGSKSKAKAAPKAPARGPRSL